MTALTSVIFLAVHSVEVRTQAQALEEQIRGRFQSFEIAASSCGAIANPEVDDTQALQRCIDSLPVYATLDGEGKTYLVSTLSLKSKMRLRRFSFLKFAGVANMTSVINLDGRRDAQSDVVLEDIRINGMRGFERAMVTPSAEDGGRHCFRVAGKVRDVVLANVEGNYCGTDGLQLGGHHATLSDAPEQLAVQNVVVRGARFHWNRRVGIAFEGAHNVFFVNVEAKFNGRTIANETDRTSGAHCAHVNGYCFGSGVWTENDHDAAGGSFDSVYFVNLNATGNEVRGFYAFSQSGPKVAGFRTKGNLAILDSTIDAGINPIAGNPIAVQFNSNSPDAGGAVYDGIVIAGSTIDGTICGRLLANLAVRSSRVTAALMGFLEYFDNVTVTGVERRGDFLSSLWLRPDGAAGAVVRYEVR